MICVFASLSCRLLELIHSLMLARQAVNFSMPVLALKAGTEMKSLQSSALTLYLVHGRAEHIGQ